MRIGIIGCGYAGGAAALLLHRSGHDVSVFEAVAAPAPIGAGILIQPTGLSVLARLGLLQSTLSRASRVDGLRIRSAAGRTLMDLRYRDLQSTWFGCGLHRGALFESIFGAVSDELADVHLGVRIMDVVEAAGGKRTMIDDSGEEHGPFDLVVVADGARSQVREQWQHGKGSEYAWGAAWFVGPDPDGAFAGELYQTVHGTQRMMGLLPTGLGPGTGTTPLVSLYWSLHESAVEQWRARGLRAFVEEVSKFDPRAAPVMESIEDFEQVLFARYQRVVMRPWFHKGVLFIGDAAHAMSPQLGQGTNLALMDALVLGECIANASSHRELVAGLAAYQRIRRPQLAFYELAAHGLTPLFQSSLPGLGIVRDAMFSVLSRLPWVDGQMLQTMAGVKRGIIRPSMKLQLPALPSPPA